MKAPAGFDIWVEDDRVRVKFVPAATLGRLRSGHALGGDYGDYAIRLARYESRSGNRATLMHELGHYLCDRQEIRAKDTTEEEICDVLTWIPMILNDKRNAALRAFLGL